MLFLPDPWFGSFNPAFLCISSSLANCTPLVRHAQQMNGRSVSSLHFWLGLCCTPRLRFTFQASELFTLIKGSQIRLQRVVRGIKRCQGTPSSTRLPITDNLSVVIWQSLDLGLPDHQMFWATCSLEYFCFLHAS